ncbi:MAG TPA: membrane dipeptidase [Planctomycetota bacterium]|nr:membrane dipeptidase [Planctomycetota bacterium]
MNLIFDGHLDLAWNALSWDRDQTEDLGALNRSDALLGDDDARGRATTTLPEMRKGLVAACLATVLVRARPDSRPTRGHLRTSLDFPSQAVAYAMGQGQLAYYRLLEKEGHMKMIRTARDLDEHWKRWEEDPAGSEPIGFILAMEGADPIVDPLQAEEWWEAGLRSLNLVHYGKGPYGAGTGAEGPLTPRGVELLREMERLGIILDVTHLSDEGFFDALERYGGRVLASHQNCRALVPGVRQFSDEQLKLLIERDAVIGAPFDAWMSWPGWETGVTSRDVLGIEAVVRHIDHICALAGNVRHVAIGSDLDGGFGTEQTPSGIDSIADLQKLEAILESRGYNAPDIRAIFHGNWLRFFREHLPR